MNAYSKHVPKEAFVFSIKRPHPLFSPLARGYDSASSASRCDFIPDTGPEGARGGRTRACVCVRSRGAAE